ncbi:MAG: ribonuclease III [Candidatus Magasanikbacteria bacterium CG10_big_fil_rev_8_21_14_0_10_36_32]|uniref:Ribonuclease 3 n=1 Tax=Candidatus Magasanikbacteria bacterium CG10_big_fil_rev_8_21_14_0_10_36_32 TaxID=1974646 RepID=A0A2M6W7D2_9BACT|nr:MAG: ribonuclease III [Candidatus Magasanikbacteria bacterium CG10_big_fil_rev_8_21_14_0_10_36_32]
MNIIDKPEVQKKNFSSLEEKLGLKFKNINFLIQAFVHRSFLNEHHDFPLGNNERLEFLGDAVVELVVTEYLFNEFGNPEGELTNWRAALVNAKLLSGIAYELGLEPYLFMSRGEEKDAGTKARDIIMANAFESLTGAIYLDGGYEASKKFISQCVLTKLPYILENGLYMDAKSRLQEAAQELIGFTPNYKVLSEEGPDHAKIFKVGVYFDNELIAVGEGSSKQEAQTEAAEMGLKIKNWKSTSKHIIKRKEGDPI